MQVSAAGSRMAKPQFSSPAQPPMGLRGEFAAAGARQVHVIILEPGDRVLLCTDGMTQGAARVAPSSGSSCSPASSSRATAARELASEELRLLIHAILDHQENEFGDDAAIMLLERRPSPSTAPSGRR